MKKGLLVLMTGLMAMSYGCSTAPIVQRQVAEIPASLLMPLPIESVTEPTVRGLAEAYIDNTLQLGLANRRLESIRQWQDDQRGVYENTDKASP